MGDPISYQISWGEHCPSEGRERGGERENGFQNRKKQEVAEYIIHIAH